MTGVAGAGAGLVTSASGGFTTELLEPRPKNTPAATAPRTRTLAAAPTITRRWPGFLLTPSSTPAVSTALVLDRPALLARDTPIADDDRAAAFINAPDSRSRLMRLRSARSPAAS